MPSRLIILGVEDITIQGIPGVGSRRWKVMGIAEELCISYPVGA